MVKNNDGRLEHPAPIPDFVKQVFIEYLILFSYFCSSTQEQYLRQILMPQIQYCLLTQRGRV